MFHVCVLDMNEIFDRRETILDFTKVQNYLAPFFFFSAKYVTSFYFIRRRSEKLLT